MKRHIKWVSLLLVIAMLISSLLTGCSDVEYDVEYDDEYDEETADNSENVVSDTEDEASNKGDESGNDEENGKTDEDDKDEKNKATSLDGFVAGTFFQVKFEKDGQTYCAIADANGKILYYTSQFSGGHNYFSGVDFTPIGKNAGYLTKTIDNKSVYTLINTSGLKKTFAPDEFDMILGEGGGYMLVYKNTGNISKAEHSYGLINSNGEWEKPLTPGTQIPTNEKYTHMGEKVFVQYDYYGNSEHYVVFDCKNNTTIGFDDCTIRNTSFNDGSYFVWSGQWFSSYSKPYGSEEVELEFTTCLFNKDGTYQETKPIAAASDKMALYRENDKLYVWNLKTNTHKAFDAYPEETITIMGCIGDYTLLTIKGQDGNLYFTTINADGEQQFEPKICATMFHMAFAGDKITYTNMEGFYEMVDARGNVIVSEDWKSDGLSTDGEGVAVQTDDTRTLLDHNGKEMTFYLTKDSIND